MRRLSSSDLSDALLGARDMLPMTLAASTYGAAFGILAINAGFSASQALTMSTLVFGGSAQLIALDQLVNNAGAGAAILAGAALNMRILLVTASMRPALAGRPWWQILAGVYIATDASVALIQSARERGLQDGYWHQFGGNASLLIVWILATSLGALLSYGIPSPERFGLDFAIIAVFVALLPGLWRGRSDLRPWIVAAASVVGITYLFPLQAGWALIIGAVLGAVTAGVTHDE